MSRLAAFDLSDYRFEQANELITPCLLVYPEFVQQNVQEAIRIAGGAEFLRPHVKTHKTPEIVAMQLELGIHKHKCATLREAEMLAECGAADVLIAYPQVGPAIAKLCELIHAYPNTKFAVLSESVDNLRDLERGALNAQRECVSVWIDIDCGMHRTGIEAFDPTTQAVLDFLNASRVLKFTGLHVYDGHNHQSDESDRRESVRALMHPVNKLMDQLEQQGTPAPSVAFGGTPTFPIFADFRADWKHNANYELSPGTCTLSDFNYLNDYADLAGFRPASLLLTRVISKHGDQHVTLDIGNKAIAADPPAGSRCHFPELPDAQELKHNEEHLVVATEAASQLKIGDPLFALPAHICPTVALHEEMQVIENGSLRGSWKVAARGRTYRPGTPANPT